MTASYIKYTIIEVVPVELKSYRTPLITILNSVFLWIYLLVLMIRNFIIQKISPAKFFKKRYKQNKEHSESVKFSNKDEIAYDLATEFKNNSKIDFVSVDSEIITNKKKKKIFLKKLLEDETVIQYGLEPLKSKTFGNFSLRKDIITIKSNDLKNIKDIDNKIILTRSIPKPIQDYINFINKYFKFKKIQKYV